MTKPNFKNRTLYHGDNLDFLRGMNSATVHLIATDPPFNKARDFHATPGSLAAGAKFQIVWCYSGGGIPKKDYPRKHDVILRYTNSNQRTFNIERKPCAENTQQVGIHSTYSGAGNKIDLKRGTPVTDWWNNIQTTTGWSPENTGYPRWRQQRIGQPHTALRPVQPNQIQYADSFGAAA